MSSEGVINANRISGWQNEIDYDKVFTHYLGRHQGSSSLQKWFGLLLKNRVKTSTDSAKEDISLLLKQREVSCYEFAFMAMSENPVSFSKEIITILEEPQLVDNLLSTSDARYYFLEMLRAWLLAVDSDILAKVQEYIYDFKSASDLLSDKEKKYTMLYYPHLGYHQRELIWAIPGPLRNRKIRIRLL